MSKGFSLVELMIVIAIIGILSAIAIPSYQSYMVNASLATFLASTRDPDLALEEYNQTIGLNTTASINGPAVCNLSYFQNSSSGCSSGYGDNIWISTVSTVNPNYSFEMDWIVNYDNTIREVCSTDYPGGFPNCPNWNSVPGSYWAPTGTPPPGSGSRCPPDDPGCDS